MSSSSMSGDDERDSFQLRECDSPTIISQQSIAQCHIIVGPMCSGKTGHQNVELTRWADSSHYKVVKINSAKDVRSTAGVDLKRGLTSHSSSFRGLSDKITVLNIMNIKDVKIHRFDIIGIDEAQFFPGLKDTVLSWLKLGKIVYISSLDSYSNGELCGEVTKLLPYAQSFVKINANCNFCMKLNIHRPGIMTASNVKKTSDIMVGGTTEYSPACYDCHTKYNVN